MPVAISITDEDIEYAENVLLKTGQSFDRERRDFIKDLRTLDLQAVPGSGKTTALLAKLLILGRKLPLDNGAGILVISHTNAAVDEIKHRIGDICPILFEYPNFVGTIQGFVDEFFVKPYYATKNNTKLLRIDNDVYNEIVSKYNYTYLPDFTRQQQNNAKRYLRINDRYRKYRFKLNANNNVILMDSISGNELEISKPKGNTRSENYTDWSNTEKDKVKQWLIKFKTKVLRSGFICFDDAYFLADCYIKKIPKIKALIQNRFQYVFVDEMQDMGDHQYNLLEKVFYDDGNSTSIYQRIGDKNQAIFDGNVQVDSNWIDRGIKLEINGSYRFSNNIAKIVEPFGLNNITIEGKGKNSDGTDINIKPHLFLFDDETKECSIIQEFTKKIIELQTDNLIPQELKYPVKVVAWRKENDAEHKLALKSYCPKFCKEEAKPKHDYKNLHSYLLYFDKSSKTLNPIRKNILNSLIKILRLELIKNEDDRYFTKKKLLEFYKNKSETEYSKLKVQIYQWSLKILKNESESVLTEIRTFIPEFISFIDTSKSVTNSSDFINNEEVIETQLNETTENLDEIEIDCDKCKLDGKAVEVNTVHSVKGKTLTAVLYLESYFQADGRGENAKSYESQRLSDQFYGTMLNTNAGKRVKQSAKMAYVGFSRPTHFLAFAVHEDRFNSYLSEIDRDKWEILPVTSHST